MIKSFRAHHLLQAIHEYEDQSLPLDLFLNHYYRFHKALGSKDRLFLSETLYSLIRWKGLLDAVTGAPGDWAKRIDLLENHSIDELRSKAELKDYERVSCPEWLYHKLEKQWGKEKANAFCLISNEQAPPTVRTNLLKTTRDELLNTLQKYDKAVKTQASPQGIVFSTRINYFEIPEFNLGHFEIQDEGSQLLADLANPTPQDHVLDFCAGSGGKTMAFAHKMEGKGQIYLHDIRQKALLQAKKRLKKAGIQNAQFILANDPKLKKLKGKMQWVFVDAPCSGTGTFRRNPDMKWNLSEEGLEGLLGQQRSIFEQALSFLSPTGTIIYGTCSVLEEENEKQTAHFIKTYGLEMKMPPLQLLPTPQGADGFYGVALQRSAKHVS